MKIPTLVIGLGGLGHQVASEIKKRLLESHDGRLPPEIRLLVIDTVPEKEGEASDQVLESQEYCYIGGDLYAYIYGVAKGQHPEVSSWFASDHYLRTLPRAGFELAQGAGQSRQFARLALFREVAVPSQSVTYMRLREAIGSCLRAGKAERLQVFLISSLAGGTGSGVLLDIAYLVRTIATEEFRSHGILVQGYIVLPDAFLGTVPGMSAMALANARAFAAMRELSRFQTHFDWETGYPMYYHERGPDPIWRSQARSKLFDQLYFVDGSRHEHSLVNVPLMYGIVPLVADTILFALDEYAGGALAESKCNIAVYYMDMAGRGEQTTAPLGGTFSVFSIELPIRHLVEEWSHKLALEVLDILLAPATKAADSGAPASLSLDANAEAGLGRPGRDEAWSFLRTAQVSGPLGQIGMPRLTVEIAQIVAALGPDHSGLIRELASRDFRDWIWIFDPGSTDEELAAIRQRLDSMLDSAKLSYRIPTSKQLKEDPLLGAHRIEQEIIQRKMQLLGPESPEGTHKGGMAREVFETLRNVHLSRFHHALLIQIDRILNGVSEDPYIAKAGKIGYALDFLEGLHKALGTTVTVLDQTRRAKESEYQIYESIAAAERERHKMKVEAGRKLFGFIVHPAAFQAQERYLQAEQVLIEVEFSRIALSTLIQTVQEMQRCVLASHRSLTSWVEALALNREGLYTTVLGEIGQLRQKRELEKRSVSRLVLYDEEYEAARYDFYVQQTGDWIARLLGSFRWVVGLQTTDDDQEGVEVSLRVGGKSLSLDPPRYSLHALLEQSREPFFRAVDSESVISFLIQKYVPEEVVDILFHTSEPALQFRPELQYPPHYPIVSYYLGIRTDQDPRQRAYIEEVLNGLSARLSASSYRLQLVALEDRMKCVFVVYEEPISLASSDAYVRATEEYYALQASGKIDGRLVHVFPAEANAVAYEQRLPRELQQQYRPFHPRVVALIEYPERVALFTRACMYDLIKIAQDENGHSFTQLQLPVDKPAALHPHTDEVVLTPTDLESADWFEALLTFVYRGTDRRDYVHRSIDYTRVQEACAQIQQGIGELDEIIALAEGFLSRVVMPLEGNTDSVLHRDLGSLLHFIVQDEINNLRKLGQLGLGFFSLWDNLDVADFRQRVRAFCTRLSRASALPLMETEATDEDLLLFAIDAKRAFTEITLPFPVLPILFLRKRQLTQSDVDRIRRLVENSIGVACKAALLVVFADQDDLEDARRLLSETMKEAYAYDIICPSSEDLRSVVVAEQGQAVLRHLVLSQINLTTVSPFVVTGSTPDNMFFGREKELREITEHAVAVSYALIGGRRFGKTSILKRLERVRLPSAGFRALYHDCSFTPTQAELVQAVTTDKTWFPEPLANPPVSFADIIQSLPDDKPPVILLDEADKLIAHDRVVGYPLFNAMRAMSNSGRCRFVLAGEQVIRAELTNPNSPLYNFANVMLIGRLDFSAVEELVTRPMKQLEIELADETEMVQRIWDFTSGHPNVVQRFCQRLIVRLNQRGDRRLTLDDIETVVADPDFLRNDFLSIYWERATALERLCSLVMAAHDDVRTLPMVHEALTHRGLEVTLNQVDDALERLVDLRNILHRTAKGYEFAVTAFPEVIAKTARLDDLLALNRETYQHHGDVEPRLKRGAP
ncbi:MAG: hypothetical protein H8D43_02335 [Chloroflexi bacterium]|nr:hypothetical protein [Chloroflexota bacterium]